MWDIKRNWKFIVVDVSIIYIVWIEYIDCILFYKIKCDLKIKKEWYCNFNKLGFFYFMLEKVFF